MAQYDHDEGNAVGGGYVYRGADATLRGKYLFTEFVRGRLLAIDAEDLQSGVQVRIEEVRLTFEDEEKALVDVAGFYNPYTRGRRVDARLGIDHDGELYLLTKGDGWIRKLVTENTYRVPLFLAARRSPQQQGFVRIVNHGERAGTVRVAAIDDAGQRFDRFTIELDALETRHFNSNDLEMGNASKGLATGIGAGTGDWRLQITSHLPLEVLAYVRTQDGFLTSMHDTVRKPGARHLVPIFNPASNTNQVSSLRLANRGDNDANIAIVGVDDRGRQTNPVGFVLAPSAARQITAQQLEAGSPDLSGSFGDGNGKWRLYVSADQPLEVMNLLASPTGHLTNLSSSTAAADFGLPSEAVATSGDPGAYSEHLPLFASASDASPQGFVRLVNHTARTATLTIRATDDQGTAAPPLPLSLAPWQAMHFNSDDLERGNPAKGIANGVGSGRGEWRLDVESDIAVEALAYMRTTDGFLTSVHDAARLRGEQHAVPTFNPGRNQNQVSKLRLVNNTQSNLEVNVVGRDDSGLEAPPVRLAVAAGNAREIRAQDLQSSGLGEGRGKWYLFVSAAAPVTVMSLLESASGHLANLSTSPNAADAP